MISIVMPTFNRANKIARSIQSVLEQTYQDWELIIIDDGGTDDTGGLIKRKFAQYEQIYYVKNSVNKGVSHARNTGIKAANGEYIAFLDSDDCWYPYHLENSLEILRNSCYKICSALWDEDRAGALTYIADVDWFRELLNNVENTFGIKKTEPVWKFDHRFYEFVLTTNFYCFQINTILIEKSIFADVGLFNEELRMSEDMEFLYRVFSKYPLVTINRPHFLYYFGNDNLYAYLGRDDNFEDISAETKTKLSKNLKYKIDFFVTLNDNLIASNFNFADTDAVFKSISYSIALRCLTWMLLNGKGSEAFTNFENLAQKYAINNELRFYLNHYDEPDVIPQYICLD